jgi:Cof subfamily protein (haloacid dehalogenase superfamily)
MEKKYKLLVADIDGTIANEKGIISIKDLESIEKVILSGIPIALCTDRSVKACALVLLNFPSEGYHIFFDGALICNADQTETIFARTIDKKRLADICNLAHLDGVTLELFSQTGYFVEQSSALASLHSHLMKVDWTVAEFPKLIEKEPIVMGCLVIPVTEESIYRTVLTDFGERKGLKFNWVMHPLWPMVRFVNITMDDVSTGRALKTLCVNMKINLDDVAAIGGSGNDVSMLEAAGLAIAMQTAPPELKAVADVVTADVKYNGFSQAIQEFLL